jgi:hypothetical protein
LTNKTTVPADILRIATTLRSIASYETHVCPAVLQVAMRQSAEKMQAMPPHPRIRALRQQLVEASECEVLPFLRAAMLFLAGEIEDEAERQAHNVRGLVVAFPAAKRKTTWGEQVAKSASELENP